MRERHTIRHTLEDLSGNNSRHPGESPSLSPGPRLLPPHTAAPLTSGDADLKAVYPGWKGKNCRVSMALG